MLDDVVSGSHRAACPPQAESRVVEKLLAHIDRLTQDYKFNLEVLAQRDKELAECDRKHHHHHRTSHHAPSPSPPPPPPSRPSVSTESIALLTYLQKTEKGAAESQLIQYLIRSALSAMEGGGGGGGGGGERLPRMGSGGGQVREALKHIAEKERMNASCDQRFVGDVESALEQLKGTPKKEKERGKKSPRECIETAILMETDEVRLRALKTVLSAYRATSHSRSPPSPTSSTSSDINAINAPKKRKKKVFTKHHLLPTTSLRSIICAKHDIERVPPKGKAPEDDMVSFPYSDVLYMKKKLWGYKRRVKELTAGLAQSTTERTVLKDQLSRLFIDLAAVRRDRDSLLDLSNRQGALAELKIKKEKAEKGEEAQAEEEEEDGVRGRALTGERKLRGGSASSRGRVGATTATTTGVSQQGRHSVERGRGSGGGAPGRATVRSVSGGGGGGGGASAVGVSKKRAAVNSKANEKQIVDEGAIRRVGGVVLRNYSVR